MSRIKKARKGPQGPSSSGYVRAHPGPAGVVLSVKFPAETVAEIDRLVEERRKQNNPYASRGEIVRGIVIEHFRGALP